MDEKKRTKVCQILLPNAKSKIPIKSFSCAFLIIISLLHLVQLLLLPLYLPPRTYLLYIQYSILFIIISISISPHERKLNPYLKKLKKSKQSHVVFIVGKNIFLFLIVGDGKDLTALVHYFNSIPPRFYTYNIAFISWSVQQHR
jgi:hypothetical protein